MWARQLSELLALVKGKKRVHRAALFGALMVMHV
jgi:hypothetical protein